LQNPTVGRAPARPNGRATAPPKGTVQPMVVDQQVFASRVTRLPLVDADGATLGRVEDLVLGPAHSGRPPRLLGLVANVQRRKIFVGAGRVKNIEVRGVRLRGAAVDLGH